MGGAGRETEVVLRLRRPVCRPEQSFALIPRQSTSISSVKIQNLPNSRTKSYDIRMKNKRYTFRHFTGKCSVYPVISFFPTANSLRTVSTIASSVMSTRKRQLREVEASEVPDADDLPSASSWMTGYDRIQDSPQCSRFLEDISARCINISATRICRRSQFGRSFKGRSQFGRSKDPLKECASHPLGYLVPGLGSFGGLTRLERWGSCPKVSYNSDLDALDAMHCGKELWSTSVHLAPRFSWMIL